MNLRQSQETEPTVLLLAGRNRYANLKKLRKFLDSFRAEILNCLSYEWVYWAFTFFRVNDDAWDARDRGFFCYFLISKCFKDRDITTIATQLADHIVIQRGILVFGNVFRIKDCAITIS